MTQERARLRADALDPVEPDVAGDPPWISSTVGRRPPIRTIATGRPRADATRSGGSVGLSVTTGDLVLGHLERDRLVGVFEVDHLGHEPAAIDGVVNVVLVEDDANRVFAGVDSVGPMQMADDLDDGKELGQWTFDDSGDAQAISHAALEADGDDPAAVADRHGHGRGGEDFDGQSRRSLKPHDLDVGLEDRRRGRRRAAAPVDAGRAGVPGHGRACAEPTPGSSTLGARRATTVPAATRSPAAMTGGARPPARSWAARGRTASHAAITEHQSDGTRGLAGQPTILAVPSLVAHRLASCSDRVRV